MKKRLFVIFAGLFLGINSLPCRGDAIDLKWDFEGKNAKDWSPWGTNGIPQDKLKNIAKISDKESHSPSHSLQINDELDTANPYISLKKPVPIKKGAKYSFSGWLKSSAEEPLKVKIAVAAEKKGGFVRWLNMKTITLSNKWQSFKVDLNVIPPAATLLRPSIFPVAGSNKKLKGRIFADDLSFTELNSKPINIKSAVNRGFKDEKDGDGKGGWTDQGNNDLRRMKVKDMTIGGIPFAIIDPAKNNGKSAIVLKDTDNSFFLNAATIPVNEKFKYLNLLSAGAWMKAGAKTQIIFQYEDGSSKSIPMTAGVEVADWWNGYASGACQKIVDANAQKSKAHLFAASIKNPCPDKKVKAIEFKSFPDGQTIWMILAATASSVPCSKETANVEAVDTSDWIPFNLQNVKTSKKALLDLSFLLDAPAGKHGFLMTRNGHFFFEDGTPARFFGTNIHSNRGLYPTHEQAERAADTLSRLGVNIIRFHLTEGVTIDPDYKTSDKLVSEKQLEKFDYFVKCLKDKGIYILIDSVTGLSARKLKPGDNVPGYKLYSSHRPWAYFSKRLIEMGKKYMDDFLTRKNQYTGKSLLEEPAVALMMLINEQTLFFDWKKNKEDPSYYHELLTQMFNKWLLDKYGNREKLAKAWTGKNGKSFLGKDEDPAKGTVKTPSIFEIQGPGKWSPERVKDAVAFYKKVQSDYHKEMISHLRSLGCKIPVAASNIIYSPASLDTQRLTDYTSQNMYYNHNKRSIKGENINANIPFSAINPLDASLIEPVLAAGKIKNMPVTSTESDMMYPHEWRSGYFLSLGSTAALQNWDAIFHYCYFGGWGYPWDVADKAKGVLQGTVEFNDPGTMGMFPMAALMFHRRDAAPAKNLAEIEFSGDDKLSAKAILRKNGSFPWNYLTYVSRTENAFDKTDEDADIVIGKSEACGFKTDLLDIEDGAELAKKLDKAMKKRGLIDQDKGLQDGKIISDTGEIERNWRKCILKVDTPRTQGYTGFPKGAVKFKDIEIKPETPFATLVVTSLDGKPIAESEKLLVSSVGRVRNDGEEIIYSSSTKSPSGFEYGTDMLVKRPNGPGKGQVRMEPVKATIKLKGRSAKITPLKPDMTPMAPPQKVEGKGPKANWIERNLLFQDDESELSFKIGEKGRASAWQIVEIERP